MELARARRDREPEAAFRARDGIARLITAGRTPPFEESGSPDLTLFDWLEEAFRVEADLRGDPPPDHATMLERAGLARAAEGGAPDDVPDRPPPPGRHALPRTTPDGVQVEATVEVDADNDGVFRVDPRPGIELTVRLIKEYGEYRVRIEMGRRDAPGARRRRLRVTTADVAGLRPALLDEPAGEHDCDVCGNGHGVHLAPVHPLAQVRFRRYR